MELPPPTNLTQLKSFLDKVGYMERFIIDFATIAIPLHHLTKDKILFHWNSTSQQDFHNLKKELLTSLILMPPDYPKDFLSYISTSEVAISAILMQDDSVHIEHVIYYVSKSLVGYEFNYLELDHQCLIFVHVIKRLGYYMLHKHTKVMSPSNPLK